MTDHIIRATAANGQIRAFAASSRELVEFARSAHNTSPVATAALGRLLTAGAMMGVMMKGEKDVLTLQLAGDGPLQGATVTADAKGNVKGYVGNPSVCLPANRRGKLDVAGAVGSGYLNVIKDLGLKEPYAGQVALQTSEIAEDLTYYFAASEQVPSTVGLGVLMNRENTVRQAGGFIIQLLPFAEESVIARLEQNLTGVTSVTQMLEDGLSPQGILQKLLAGMALEITDTLPIRFHCNCGKNRMEKALISIGQKEMEEILADGEPIEMHCHFCGSRYTFTIEELQNIYKRCRR